MNHRSRYFIAFLPFSILVLLAIAFINRDTPFRGEHWALLCAWVQGDTWFDKLSRVINIEYFGDHRFQPLNSAPMILGYLVFGIRFFPYLVVSIVLQLLLGLGVVRLLSVLENRNAAEPYSTLLKKYPVEFSLFVVLFPGMEVMFWTYFHYIQIATVLTVFAIGLYFKNGGVVDRLKAYLLITLACLFYEPFLLVLGILLLVNAFEYKHHKFAFGSDYALPLALCLVIGSRYLSSTVSKPVTVPPDVSVFNGILLQPGHIGIFEAPGVYYKFLFLCYNQVLLVIHLAMNTLLPSFANKTNLFEMVPIPLAVEAFLPLLLVVVVILLVVFKKYFNREHRILLLVATTCFGVIVWGRPGAGHYASTQFRYGYIVLPFLFLVAVDLLKKAHLSKVVLASLVGYVFTVNVASSLVHGVRLKTSFLSYSKFITEKKSQYADSDQIVNATAKAILEYKIPATGHDVFLIYNGRGGMGKFYRK